MRSTIGNLIAFVLFFIGLTSCKTSSTTDESAAASDSTAVQSKAPALVTICMLPEVGIRETPGEAGKYLTTLYLSETVTLTGDSATAEAGGKSYNYYKVQLEDGKQGWVRTDFIAKNVVPAVFAAVTSINKRPDMASATEKNFSAMDIVATRPAKDNWIEVAGIPFGDKWFIKGYVHPDNLSYDPVDISFAALYKRAGGMKDLAKSKAMMDQLSLNKDLQASRFYAQAFGGDDEGEEGDGGEGDGGEGDPMGNDMNSTFAEYGFENGNYTDYKNGAQLDNRGVTTADRAGVANGAAKFNGSASLSGPLFQDFQDVTYMLWVKSDKPQTATILALGNNCTAGYSLTLANSVINVLCGGVTGNVTNSTYSLPAGEWVHVALVKSGNNFSLYVNGELSSRGSSPHNSLTSLFTIGAGSGCEDKVIGDYFTGSIDDVDIYSRAFESGEVREQYQQAGQ